MRPADPNQADLRVLDSFNPNEPLLQFVREHGVTVVHAMPAGATSSQARRASFELMAGPSSQMKLRFPAGILVNLARRPRDLPHAHLDAHGDSQPAANHLKLRHRLTPRNATRTRRPTNLKHEAA